MTRLIRAEALKLRSTRAFRLLTVGALALIAVAVTATSAATTYTPGTDPARATLALTGLAQTFALLAGTLAVTSEFRHKTIIPAVLITPRRTQLLAAKLITLTACGLAFGLLATGAAAAIAMPILAARHVASQIGGAQLAGIIGGGVVATALCAALGVGVGTIIRNQVGAIIAILGLLYVAEPLLGFIPGVGAAVQTFGLGGLASGATGTTGFPASARLLGQAPAALTLGGYALTVLLAGAVLLRRRDITT
jgi:ABC-2 type transport system permease protein